jgi:periplasmic divalent cation tolerance protein
VPERSGLNVEFVVVLVTFPADQDHEPLARTLVDERLAACVNVLPPMESIYRWEGAVEHATERQLVIKTAVPRLDELKARVAQLHPYSVPEILVLPVAGGGDAYLEWVTSSTRVPSP